MPRKVSHVVIHTAAAASKGKPFDCSALQIGEWHRAKGWSSIGYHWVVRFSGQVEKGRPESEVGAGVFGFNAHSVHVCLSGHGDLAEPTAWQWASAVSLTARILERHSLAGAFRKNPNRVLGHREVWFLRLVPAPIRKTCPGAKVDMRVFRLAVMEALNG